MLAWNQSCWKLILTLSYTGTTDTKYIHRHLPAHSPMEWETHPSHRHQSTRTDGVPLEQCLPQPDIHHREIYARMNTHTATYWHMQRYSHIRNHTCLHSIGQAQHFPNFYHGSLPHKIFKIRKETVDDNPTGKQARAHSAVSSQCVLGRISLKEYT